MLRIKENRENKTLTSSLTVDPITIFFSLDVIKERHLFEMLSKGLVSEVLSPSRLLIILGMT